MAALEVLRLRGAPVTAVVVSESDGASHPGFSETVAVAPSLAAPTPVIAARRNAIDCWSLALLWLVEEAQGDPR